MKENGKKAIIQRELGNHEYCVTYDITDTVEKLADYPITEEEIKAETKPYLERHYKWEEEQDNLYKVQKMTDEKCLELYLTWVNDFVSLENFVEYCELDEKSAEILIDRGRKINEQLAEAV